MRLSRIYQLPTDHGSSRSTTLWTRIRELRIRAGLTQAELGAPMTRSFVSAVENGRAVLSLPALTLMSSRLDVPVAELLRGLEWTSWARYTCAHDGSGEAPPRDSG